MSKLCVLPITIEADAARAIAKAKTVLRSHDVAGVALVVVYRDGATGTLHSATGSRYGRALHSAATFLANKIERDFYA